MPDILFYQQAPAVKLGLTALVPYLSKAGYSVDVLIEQLETDPIGNLCKNPPGAIGFSVFSGDHAWLKATAQKIRAALPHIPIIIGGTHAMIYPRFILEDTVADAVCTGDGEKTLVQWLEARRQSGDLSAIFGLAFRTPDGKIVENAPAPLHQYEEGVIEDRSPYYRRYPQLAEYKEHSFLSSRGCPFSCAFCFNAMLRDKVKGLGKFLRRKPPEVFLKEIVRGGEGSGMQFICFMDDLFTADPAWLRAFVPLYVRDVHLPFFCTVRANMMCEETARLLAEAGCITVAMGLESGCERIREGLLHKHITDEQVISTTKMLQRYGIHVRSTNMFCLPDETLGDALQTVNLNIAAGVDFAFSCLFVPYPGTPLFDYCCSKGYIPANTTVDDLPKSAFRTCIMKLPDKRKLMNVHYLLFFIVRYPWLRPLLLRMAKYEWMNCPCQMIFLLGNVICHKLERRESWLTTLQFAWNVRKLL